MITIACVKTKGKGRRDCYNGHYVANLQLMVRRHLKQPHRFVCIADDARDLPKDVIPIKAKAEGWWAKLQLFDPQNGLTGTVLYIDLDSLIVGDLEPFIDDTDPLTMTPKSSNWKPRGRQRVNATHSSAVMCLQAGVYPHIWETFDPVRVPRVYHGDQDWIAACLENELPPRFPRVKFARISQMIDAGGVWRPTTGIIHCVKPKNHLAARKHAWVRDIWPLVPEKSSPDVTMFQSSRRTSWRRRNRSR